MVLDRLILAAESFLLTLTYDSCQFTHKITDEVQLLVKFQNRTDSPQITSRLRENSAAEPPFSCSILYVYSLCSSVCSLHSFSCSIDYAGMITNSRTYVR